MRLLLAALALLVVAGVVVALLVATSSNGPSGATRVSASRASNASVAGKSGRVNPASVTVSVLNGTSVVGLAHKISLRLGAAGYRPGTISTASDQTRTATVVAYTSGRKADALQVASALKLGPASVQPVDPSTQAVACPPPSACAAEVVVTVGRDLASQ